MVDGKVGDLHTPLGASAEVKPIKLGEPDDAYPGDTAAEKTTRDYCSKSVAAWLGYPVDYDYGYTWFHEAEWDAGNRRSVCWAKTSQ